jgi:hypothetical protein
MGMHPSQTIRKRDDETVEVKLKVAINPELQRWLWSWGEAVEVVSPNNFTRERASFAPTRCCS